MNGYGLFESPIDAGLTAGAGRVPLWVRVAFWGPFGLTLVWLAFGELSRDNPKLAPLAPLATAAAPVVLAVAVLGFGSVFGMCLVLLAARLLGFRRSHP